MFLVVFVFIEHVIVFISIIHHVDINANKNINSKLTFESEAQSQGVSIKSYQDKNVVFNVLDFMW